MVGMSKEVHDAADFDYFALLDAANISHDTNKTLAPRTVTKRAAAWEQLCDYVEHMNAIGESSKLAGSPTHGDQYLDRSFPALTWQVITGTLVRWAGAAFGRIKDVPTVVTAKDLLVSLVCHYEDIRGQELSPIDRKGAFAFIHNDMVKQKLLVKVKRRRFITDASGYEQLARTCLHGAFARNSSRSRFNMLFWMALESQTGLRAGSSFSWSQECERTGIRYRDVYLCVQPPQQGGASNRISLVYRPRNFKTPTGEFGKHPLIESPQYWSCPVFWFLVLAKKDDVLPVPFETMRDPAFLEGLPLKCVEFGDDVGDLKVFRFGLDGEGGAISVRMNSCTLARLSRLAGFEHPLGQHAFRRMVAIYMRVTGSSLEDIEGKLDHVWKTATVLTYLRQVCSCDVGSLMYGMPISRMFDAIALHPDTLRSQFDVEGIRNAVDYLGITTLGELADFSDKRRRHETEFESGESVSDSIEEPIEDDSEQDVGATLEAELVEEDFDNTVLNKYSDDLSAIRHIVFNPRSALADRELMVLCASLPHLRSDMSAYRPGHSPINSICRFCDRPLKDLCDPGADPAAYRTLCYAHVDSCGAGRTLNDCMPHLQATLKTVPPVYPLIGKKMAKKTVLNLESVAVAIQKETRFGRLVNCHCGAVLDTFTSAEAHYLVDCSIAPFYIKLPMASKPYRGQLSFEDFPLPAWYYADNRYHADPVELELFCRRLYANEFLEKITPGVPYGTLGADTYPDEWIVSDPRDMPRDTKYDAVYDEHGRQIHDRFCLLCVCDPNSSFTQGLRPINTRQTMRVHCANHAAQLMTMARRWVARQSASTALENDEDAIVAGEGLLEAADPTEDVTVADEPVSNKKATRREKRNSLNEQLRVHRPYCYGRLGLECPDPTCQLNEHGPLSELDFVRHLILVHGVPILAPKQKIEAIAASQATLDKWLKPHVKDRIKPGCQVGHPSLMLAWPAALPDRGPDFVPHEEAWETSKRAVAPRRAKYSDKRRVQRAEASARNMATKLAGIAERRAREMARAGDGSDESDSDTNETASGPRSASEDDVGSDDDDPAPSSSRSKKRRTG